MKVLICGSRTFTDEATIALQLKAAQAKYGSDLTVIHGAARGADSLAAGVADALDIAAEAYPADWGKYGKRAGYVRNQQMLVEGKPDLVLAFRSTGESRGTDMMVDLARKAGVPTYVYTTA